jgi:hypothetical protein
MPLYPVNSSWSAAIPVASGNVVQNQGQNTIYVCPGATAERGNSIEIKPDRAYRIESATQIFISTLGPRASLACIIVGA